MQSRQLWISVKLLKTRHFRKWLLQHFQATDLFFKSQLYSDLIQQIDCRPDNWESRSIFSTYAPFGNYCCNILGPMQQFSKVKWYSTSIVKLTIENLAQKFRNTPLAETTLSTSEGRHSAVNSSIQNNNRIDSWDFFFIGAKMLQHLGANEDILKCQLWCYSRMHAELPFENIYLEILRKPGDLSYWKLKLGMRKETYIWNLYMRKETYIWNLYMRKETYSCLLRMSTLKCWERPKLLKEQNTTYAKRDLYMKPIYTKRDLYMRKETCKDEGIWREASPLKSTLQSIYYKE